MYHHPAVLHKDYRSGVETPEKMRALAAALYASKGSKQVPLFPKNTPNITATRQKTYHFVDLPSSESEDSLTSDQK